MHLINKLINLPTFFRRLILVLVDLVILNLSCYLILFDKFSDFLKAKALIFTFFISIFAIVIYIYNGQYKSLSKFVGSKDIYQLIIRNLFICLLIIFLNYSFKTIDLDFKKLFLFWISTNGSMGLFRLISRDILINLPIAGDLKPQKSIIYGAGMAGVQLLAMLRLSKKYKIQYFVDDNPELWNREIDGIRIIARKRFKQIFKRDSISQILLAIPSLKPSQKRNLLNNLKEFKIPIFQIPSLDDIKRGDEKISSLKLIKIEDFLGRDEVASDASSLYEEFNNKNICIFGAAGSIGSEICRQLYKQDPKKLIFFDHSEIGLYTLMQFFENTNSERKTQIIPILGSCLDSSLVENIFEKHDIQIVFHAAAYKHVPLVEINPIQGIKNNIISTLVICKAALSNSVEKVLLISTDKAVRPTNIMGASKRIAEIILQAYAYHASLKNYSTIFLWLDLKCLNSSGSVIPLFEKQIKKGGPITVTHPKITRYFMTIKEAT